MNSGRTVVDGRFELLEPLGSGGMGTVWRAYDLALHREVALKEVKPADPESSAGAAGVQRERVLREARALARIGHPNVVAVHHIVDSPEHPHPWIVMELVRGKSLSDRLAQAPLGPAEAAAIGRGILAGLRAAHQVGVLHRDIKPANVLLREDGSPVLTDFGIAALADATGLTGTGNLVGSLDYVAPERLAGEEGNPASDLWSLGLLLFVAVEGYHPMRRETTVATLAAVLQGTVPIPQRAGPLTPVLQSILVADPKHRASMEQVDHQLAQLTTSGSHPVAANPYAHPAQHGSTPSYPVQHGTSTPAYPVQHGTGPSTPVYGQQYTPPAAPVAKPTHAQPGYLQPGHNQAGHNQAGHAGAGHPGVYPYPPQRSGMSAGAKVGLAAAALVTVAAVAAAVVVLRPDGGSGAPGSTPGSVLASGVVPPSGVVISPSGVRIVDTPSTGSQQIGDLLTPAGIRQAITALEKVSGGTQFTEASFYENFANAAAPVSGQPKLYDEYTYRNGSATRKGAGGQIDDDDKTIQLNSINWDLIPGLFATANEKLNVPKPTMRYVIVEPAWTFNDDRPALLIYLTDDYGGAYLAANLDGSIVSMYPR
ncbi:protein kinase domain-containing protein [Nocardia takedensis]|uniref:serine/threonine-protein kinase n=1 Tax=Nocardia takedensis TaxID=259390 RepID=UPI001C3F3DAA|nr:serine/threonine-protein kinase [Nocardia takedensis]